MNLDVAPWQWSHAVQITSVLMIAGFFAVRWRSVPRAEMRRRVYAWSADFVALFVTPLPDSCAQPTICA